MDSAPPILWSPTVEQLRHAGLIRFAAHVGRSELDYAALHAWSTSDLEGFWSAVVDFCDVRFSTPPTRVLGAARMPGAEWFPGAELSYPEHFFAGRDDGAIAIRHASELRPLDAWTWGRLRSEVARIRAGLVAHGVGRGDRVCAYMPNVPETIAAFLATASLGAIWSSAAPEFGARSVVDRFAQIEPAVLLAVDGYRYGGRDFDRREVVEAIHAEVGGELVVFGYADGAGWPDGFLADGPLDFTQVPFDHPLWVLYSSGTTGLPKAIVHSHGGMLLEQKKTAALHLDATADDRVFWFTTTGWMMWNYLVGVLLSPASIVCFDGNPAGNVLWELAADAGVTVFGTSAAFIGAQMKAGAAPAHGRDLSALRAVGSTGSPLAPEGFQWVADQLGDEVWLFSTSGGTDVCTAFVGGVPTLPVYRGELQGPAMGAALEAWGEDGQPLIGEVGELVITRPMPSMPVCFWNDPDGARLREAYFEMFPGVWRHGDWIEITDRGTAIIFGRSDSTINRGGVRMGTSEIYSAVLALDEVTDALVVDVPREGAESWMPLFVVLRDGGDEVDDDVRRRIAARVRADCSPRHVPDDVFAIAEVPRTLSGKVLEVPVKRVLMGTAIDAAASRESLQNPAALDWFAALAARRAAAD